MGNDAQRRETETICGRVNPGTGQVAEAATAAPELQPVVDIVVSENQRLDGEPLDRLEDLSYAHFLGGHERHTLEMEMLEIRPLEDVADMDKSLWRQGSDVHGEAG